MEGMLFLCLDCGSVPTPVRGVQEVKFTTYGSKIEFSCLPGFQLRGFDTLICTETGEWSQKLPTCETIGKSLVKCQS